MEIKLLSVIVPIYKQENTIRENLLRIYEVLAGTAYKFEIIGIVDGTDLDNSLGEAKKAEKSNLKIYGYKNNKGKGQAVRYGMQKSKGDVVIFIDSGGDINPQGITMLLSHMEWYNADIIVGSKSHPASKVNYPLSRLILSKGYYYIVKLMFGLRLRDTQTGLKAYKREVLNAVLDRLVVKRFAFDIEILAVAHQMGFTRIYDAPVEVNMDFSKSTIVGVFTDNGVWRFLYDTTAVWYRMHILNYYKDGRKRVKVFDEDLNMNVNTGDMTDERQHTINFVNKFVSMIKPYKNKSDGK